MINRSDVNIRFNMSEHNQKWNCSSFWHFDFRLILTKPVLCAPLSLVCVGLSGSYTLPPVSDSHISQLSKAADVSLTRHTDTHHYTCTQRDLWKFKRRPLADISIISHMALLQDRTLSIMARTASVYRKLAVIITFHILSCNILFEISNKTKKNKAAILTGWKINYFYLTRSEKKSQNINRIAWPVEPNDNIKIKSQ